MTLWIMIKDALKENFFLKRKKDCFPVTILSKRLYIFPNRFGLFFLFILLVMLAGSVNYHNNLGYMMTFLLGGIYLMSFHLTHKNLKGLKISDVEAKPVFAGDDLFIVISILNTDFVRNNIVFEVDGFGKHDARNIENGFSVFRIKVKTEKRGITRIKDISISSDYPLGLTRTWTYILPENLEVIVYPRPLLTNETPFFSIESGNETGGSGISKTGADDFSELKNYIPGDPVQRIAWKSLSSGHGLMTKYFEGSSAPIAYLVDWKLLSNDSSEKKLGKMAHLVIDSEKKNKRYGLSLPGKTISPSRGASHMHDCLRILADYV